MHAPYFGKDALTDKPARFFVTEIIREKILLNYDKEIPYAVEVLVEKFEEKEHSIHIMAVIYVERDSQKGIIIGRGGEKLKKVGKEARLDIEQFFGKSVYLELFVKVEPDWRNRENKLRQFGYTEYASPPRRRNMTPRYHNFLYICGESKCLRHRAPA